MSPKFLLSTMTGLVFQLAIVTSTGNAALVLETDFDALGANTNLIAGDLNTVTTGGSWTLNGGANSVSSVSGQPTILFDFTPAPPGLNSFGELGFNSPIGLGTNDVTVDFTTAMRRTGSGKDMIYDFQDTAGNTLAKVFWQAGTGDVFLSNDATLGTNIGNSVFQFNNNFDPNAAGYRDVSMSFAGGLATVNFEGLIGSVAAGSGQLASLEFFSDGGGPTAKGFFLADVTVNSVTAIPEPSSLALLALGGTAIGWKRRRRGR